MSKQFEDALMEIQSGLISLCLEATGKEIEKVYAYASIEKGMKTFNAFYQRGNAIVSLRQLGAGASLIRSFLTESVKDLEKLELLCREMNRPCPCEIKIIYNVHTGAFDSDMKYESVCGPDADTTPGQVFMEWMKSAKEKT